MKEKWFCFAAVLIFCICGLLPAMAQTAQFKVLVVMSYEDTYPFEQEMKEGIDAVLTETCEVKYFYMNTKTNLKGGKAASQKAYELYQQFQPHGVIAADDNAQSMFVVPYLKDKVKTPVMFCGVNAEPEKYGYPASNVSGILERYHIAESVVLAQQLVPSIQTVGFIAKKSPTADAVLKQIQHDANTYPAKFSVFKQPETMKEAIAMTTELKTMCDLLFIAPMEGIADDNGKSLEEKEIVPALVKIFGKPTISSTGDRVKLGVLCAVVQRGQEQGGTAAQMLLEAMKGKPISDIPITRNHQGKAIININTMKALKIKPKSTIITSAELVKTEE